MRSKDNLGRKPPLVGLFSAGRYSLRLQSIRASRSTIRGRSRVRAPRCLTAIASSQTARLWQATSHKLTLRGQNGGLIRDF